MTNITVLNRVMKKNGSIVSFNQENIEKAIQKAINETNDPTSQEYIGAAEAVAERVTEGLLLLEDEIPTVNQIHKLVEDNLMGMGLYDAARKYINYREQHKRNIFKKRINIKPYEYPNFTYYIDAIRHSYWVHTEFNYSSDIQDLRVSLSEYEAGVVKRAMLAISQIESAVKEFWGKIGNRLPKPEIKKVGATFAESEVRHEDAYSNLIELLGLNFEFERLSEVPAMNKRIKYLEAVNQNNNAEDNKDFFESIILFSMFIENVSLFSQFLIIMSYNKHANLLKGMSNAVEATSKEENIHAMFGFDLVNQIKEENPSWWDQDLINYIYKITQDSYEAELEVVDWIYGGKDHDSDIAPRVLTVENLKKRYNESLVAIGLEKLFEVDQDLLAKTLWFDEEIEINKNTDFFSKRSVAYSKRDQSIEADDLWDD